MRRVKKISKIGYKFFPGLPHLHLLPVMHLTVVVVPAVWSLRHSHLYPMPIQHMSSITDPRIAILVALVWWCQKIHDCIPKIIGVVKGKDFFIKWGKNTVDYLINAQAKNV